MCGPRVVARCTGISFVARWHLRGFVPRWWIKRGIRKRGIQSFEKLIAWSILNASGSVYRGKREIRLKKWILFERCVSQRLCSQIWNSFSVVLALLGPFSFSFGVYWIESENRKKIRPVRGWKRKVARWTFALVEGFTVIRLVGSVGKKKVIVRKF